MGTEKQYPDVLDIKDIIADYEWNSRSKMQALAEGVQPEPEGGDQDKPGLEGFAETLACLGQRDPCIVNENAKGEFELVTGFRRFGAVGYLLKTDRGSRDLQPGQLRVTIKSKMSAIEKRLENASENINRKNLTPPDLVKAIKGVLEENPEVKNKVLAGHFAMGEQYMSMIMKIAKKLKEEVFVKWRSSRVAPLPIMDIYGIADLPKSEQEEAYDAALSVRRPPSAGDRKWIQSACKKASKIGTVFGAACREKIIKYNEDLELAGEDEMIRQLVKFKKSAGKKPVTNAVIQRISKAFTDAFINEKNRIPDDPEEDGD